MEPSGGPNSKKTVLEICTTQTISMLDFKCVGKGRPLLSYVALPFLNPRLQAQPWRTSGFLVSGGRRIKGGKWCKANHTFFHHKFLSLRQTQIERRKTFSKEFEIVLDWTGIFICESNQKSYVIYLGFHSGSEKNHLTA